MAALDLQTAAAAGSGAASATIQGVDLASVSGSKTVTLDAGGVTAADLTTILATAPESLTIAQLDQLRAAVRASPGGSEPGATVGPILT